MGMNAYMIALTFMEGLSQADPLNSLSVATAVLTVLTLPIMSVTLHSRTVAINF